MTCAISWCNADPSLGSRWCSQHKDENEQQIFARSLFRGESPLDNSFRLLKSPAILGGLNQRLHSTATKLSEMGQGIDSAVAGKLVPHLNTVNEQAPELANRADSWLEGKRDEKSAEMREALGRWADYAKRGGHKAAYGLARRLGIPQWKTTQEQASNRQFNPNAPRFIQEKQKEIWSTIDAQDLGRELHEAQMGGN